jgi:tetratricopeptide (TPR) repeat protein
LLRQGKRKEALVSLRLAAQLCPDDPEVRNNLGVALAEEGLLDDATEHLQEAIRLRPDYADAHHNFGNLLRRQGRLEQAEASYLHALRLTPEAADIWNNLGITLLKQGKPEDAAERFRQALRCNPGLTQAHNNLGVALADQGKTAEAAAIYRQVLQLRPESADTLNNLGVALAAHGDFAEAIAHYRAALRYKPKYPEAHNNLGNALRQEGQLDEAVASLQEALRLKPDYAEAHNNIGVARVKQGRIDEALASYQQALRLKPDYAEAHLNLALGWLLQGDFARGWPEYEWRLRMKDFALRPLPQPRWDGRPLEGSAILLRTEQGIGDTIQFIRYAAAVQQRGGSVFVECPPRLVPLLSRCRGIDRLIPQGSALPEFAFQAPILSLPGIFGTTLGSIPSVVPYLSPDPQLLERWRPELRAGAEFKIGIAWQGSPKYQGDKHRSIPLAHFAPLARLPGVRLVSLQKGFGAEQLTGIVAQWNAIDLSRRLDEESGAFADSAAILKHLDLVITSDTALAHVAGALGVPVWLALGSAPDWRWLLQREDCPWYPSMRLFRQKHWGDWDEVFERMAREIRARPARPAFSVDTRLGPAAAAEHRQRGITLIKQGKLEEAVAALRMAVQLDPTCAQTHNNLGVALVQMAKWEEAITCYRDAIRLRPDYAEAHNNLGDALQKQGQVDQAILCYRQALERKPHSPEANYNLGIALAEKGQLDEAIAYYQAALRLKPDFAMAHHHWGAALERQGKIGEATVQYQQALELAKDSPEGYQRLGTTLFAHGKLIESIASLRLALRLKPDYAEAHYYLGLALAQQNQFAEAENSLRRAIAAQPTNADAHHRLGNVLRHQDRFAEAVPCYLEALRLQPSSADVHNHLGINLLDMGKPAEAEAQFRQGIRVKADFAQAHNNLGVALEQQGRLDEAVAAYQESLRLGPEEADTHKNLGLAWLLTGNFEQGWPEYEWRWQTRPKSRRSYAQPVWNGQPLQGRPILLYAEQGLGDTIQFIRYVPLVQQRGGRVFVECPQGLIPLLSRCAGIACLIPQGAPLPDFACQAALVSLPCIFRTTLESVPARVPYLSADPILIEHWREELERTEGFKIGIAWQGSTKYVGDRHRSIPLADFEPLARVRGVRLFSLQKGFGTEQLAAVAERWGIVDLGPRLDEATGAFMDTAAVLEHLDLVITSDTSLAHLAGALGVPVWVALACARDWRWLLDREDSPWYPTMRLVRQRQWGDWGEVFRRMAQDLLAALTNSTFAKPIQVEIGAGELCDKITILEIKRERIRDAAKRNHVLTELGSLLAAQTRYVKSAEGVKPLMAELKEVNEVLWQVEEEIRACERTGDFGERFVELARSVYRENDRRAQVKSRINALLGSRLVEEKSYADISEAKEMDRPD